MSTEKDAPVSSVFNINLQSPKNLKKILPLENATLKLETPRNTSKDYKIEHVKVSMLVKDENSNETQEINGDWEPNEH
jgi:hypothetical protein